MKIDDFLAQNPWPETFELLCREPPAPRELPLDLAANLIQQQRESQLPSLIPLMLTPVVQDWPDAPEGRIHPGRDRWGVRRLREPRRTARLFIEQAVRSGKDLRHFDLADLKKLGRHDAALGRLLRLLSIADSSPLRTRGRLAAEWRDVTKRAADFGPVLSPMVADSKGDDDWESIDRLTSQLVVRLGDEPGPSSHARKDSERLHHWTTTLAREGRQRISELRAEKP